MKKSPSDNELVVQLTKVEKAFGLDVNRRAALDDVSFTGHRGELSLILGPSGSGKTTFLTIAAGLQPPTSGRVLLFGRAVEDYASAELQQLRAKRFGFVFQDFRLIESLKVYQNIELVLKFACWNRTDIRRRIEQLLNHYDVEYLRNRYPGNLSQGEKQRIAIIRAVANGGDLIFADEPTACLDTEQGQDVIHHLIGCSKNEGSCVVVVSHDIRLKDYADRIFYLQDGSLTELPEFGKSSPSQKQAGAAKITSPLSDHFVVNETKL